MYYLIWYRLEGELSDRVVGIAQNRPAAERLARQLFFSLKSWQRRPVHVTGITLVRPGQLYDDELGEGRVMIASISDESAMTPIDITLDKDPGMC